MKRSREKKTLDLAYQSINISARSICISPQPLKTMTMALNGVNMWKSEEKNIIIENKMNKSEKNTKNKMEN